MFFFSFLSYFVVFRILFVRHLCSCLFRESFPFHKFVSSICFVFCYVRQLLCYCSFLVFSALCFSRQSVLCSVFTVHFVLAHFECFQFYKSVLYSVVPVHFVTVCFDCFTFHKFASSVCLVRILLCPFSCFFSSFWVRFPQTVYWMDGAGRHRTKQLFFSFSMTN